MLSVVIVIVRIFLLNAKNTVSYRACVTVATVKVAGLLL